MIALIWFALSCNIKKRGGYFFLLEFIEIIVWENYVHPSNKCINDRVYGRFFLLFFLFGKIMFTRPINAKIIGTRVGFPYSLFGHIESTIELLECYGLGLN